jgi:hypothetical protein
MEITPDKWQRPKAVFDAALQQPRSEREYDKDHALGWLQREEVELPNWNSVVDLAGPIYDNLRSGSKI